MGPVFFPPGGQPAVDLLILGASARAAAASARRAGFEPTSVDLFADLDLAALGRAERVDPSTYPASFLDRVREWSPRPWIYTGALENHPDLVDRIAAIHPLWGNPGDVLRAVRDPMQVARALSEAGLPRPDVAITPSGLPTDGSWLVKPTASASGRGIRAWTSRQAEPDEPHYYQERIEGKSYASLYLRDWRGTHWIGLTRQWVGRPGSEFAYVGSIGPCHPPRALRQQLESIGNCLGWEFGLRGLFGVDLILKDGVAWPVEVNPRYTASAEVLELALGRPLLRSHQAAFTEPQTLRWRPEPRPGRTFVVAKRILHAHRPLTAPRVRPSAFHGYDVPELADIPQPGTRFEPGDPVMTLMDWDSNARACRDRIGRRLRRWQRQLRDQPCEGPDSRVVPD